MIVQKIALNTGWQILGKGIATISGFLVIMLLTRSLGTTGYGGFTTITAYLQFFGIIVDFGLTLIAAQMISLPAFDSKKTFNNIFSLKIVSSVIIFGTAITIAWLTHYPTIVKIGITIASISFTLNAVQQVFVGWYQKHLIIAKLALAEIAGKLTLLIGVTIVVITGSGLLAVMPVLITASAIYLFFTIYFIRNVYRPSLSFDWPVWREIMKRSWPIALGIIFNLIYLKADTIILSLTRSQAEVGIYGASFRILEVLVTLPMMLMGLLIPILSKSWVTGDRAYWKKVYQKTFDIINVIVWPMVLGGIVIAKPLMLLIAGSKFGLSAPILQILLLAFIAVALSTLFGHLIVSANMQKKAVWVYGVTALTALIWYLVFIPRFSFWAAAVTTLSAETAIMVLLFLFVGTKTHFWPRLYVSASGMIAALSMFAVLTSFPMHVILQIIFGILIYITLLSLLLRTNPRNLTHHFHF